MPDPGTGPGTGGGPGNTTTGGGTGSGSGTGAGSSSGSGAYGAVELFVWNDLNLNNAYDPGEPGLAEVSVGLWLATGESVGVGLTDSTGHFGFSNLAAGTYTLRVATPGGYVGPAPTYSEAGWNFDSITVAAGQPVSIGAWFVDHGW